jgi:hypothetical protein
VSEQVQQANKYKLLGNNASNDEMSATTAHAGRNVWGPHRRAVGGGGGTTAVQPTIGCSLQQKSIVASYAETSASV